MMGAAPAAAAREGREATRSELARAKRKARRDGVAA